jgi:hypothetical protein
MVILKTKRPNPAAAEKCDENLMEDGKLSET